MRRRGGVDESAARRYGSDGRNKGRRANRHSKPNVRGCGSARRQRAPRSSVERGSTPPGAIIAASVDRRRFSARQADNPPWLRRARGVRRSTQEEALKKVVAVVAVARVRGRRAGRRRRTGAFGWRLGRWRRWRRWRWRWRKTRRRRLLEGRRRRWGGSRQGGGGGGGGGSWQGRRRWQLAGQWRRRMAKRRRPSRMGRRLARRGSACVGRSARLEPWLEQRVEARLERRMVRRRMARGLVAGLGFRVEFGLGVVGTRLGVERVVGPQCQRQRRRSCVLVVGRAGCRGRHADLVGTRPTVVEGNSTIVMPPSTSPSTAPSPVWYYCTAPAGYFPYVQACDRAWIPVAPQSLPRNPST